MISKNDDSLQPSAPLRGAKKVDSIYDEWLQPKNLPKTG